MTAIDRLVCRETPAATLIAATSGGRLLDVRVARKDRPDLADALFLGRFDRATPDLSGAFVDLGSGRGGFLRATDAIGAERGWPPSGTPLLVQVRRDATDDKGPRLTMNVALTGRHLVLHPHGSGVAFSRRIGQETERERLRRAVEAAFGGSAEDGGVVLRTAAVRAGEDAIAAELHGLAERWEEIRRRALSAAPPADLTRFAVPDDHPLLRAVRDWGAGLVEIVVDDRLLARRAQELAARWGDRTDIRFHADGASVLDIDDIGGQIEAALAERIVLPSGVEVLFEPGRTLCAVDVDSGSAGARRGQGPRRAVEVNLEAAEAIADQLRLRNIGGAVVVDFVTMRGAFDRDKVAAAMARRFAEDPVPAQVVGFTRLGLLEATRARRGPTLAEAVGALE